jgi:hypothetical protein
LNIMARWHGQLACFLQGRDHRLSGNREQRLLRVGGARIHQVENRSLRMAEDRRMR